jgi:hypothetical protein
VTPGSTSRPATSQPPCLGRKPNARVATVSMGVKEIFPLTKCDNVLDLMFPSALRCRDSLIFSLNTFYAFA